MSAIKAYSLISNTFHCVADSQKYLKCPKQSLHSATPVAKKGWKRRIKKKKKNNKTHLLKYISTSLDNTRLRNKCQRWQPLCTGTLPWTNMLFWTPLLLVPVMPDTRQLSQLQFMFIERESNCPHQKIQCLHRGTTE